MLEDATKKLSELAINDEIIGHQFRRYVAMPPHVAMIALAMTLLQTGSPHKFLNIRIITV